MRDFLKKLISKIGVDFVERALALSILSQKFYEARLAKLYPSRESMWEDAVNLYNNQSITFLEFGVWEGYSINKFSEFSKHQDSKFFGFDSFTGLPEDWVGIFKQGAFDKGGIIPNVQDTRIKFIKGWFQNTLPEFLDQNSSSISGNLIVHYDADLYSSTLFCLNAIDALKIDYIAVFDEFAGHEARALYNYCQMSGAKVKFLGRAGEARHASQMMCRMMPAKKFEIE